MNYLVALILLGVEMDEVKAFTILIKLMEREFCDNLKMQSIYESSLKGFFAMTDEIYIWLTLE